MLTQEELKKILPQSYPFLLIDRVESYVSGESLIAIKNISANEWVFQGSEDGANQTQYFPESLLIEAAAQAALVLYHLTKVKGGQRPLYILGRANGEFFSRVEAGDQIRFQVSAGKMLGSGGYSNIHVSRRDEKVSDVEIFYSVRPQADDR